MLYFTKKAFDENNLRKLSELNKKDPKLFWDGVKKLMNNTKNRVNKSIHPSKWLPYFKKLLSPRQFKRENIKGTEKIENLLQEKEKLIHKSMGPLDKIFSQ